LATRWSRPVELTPCGNRFRVGNGSIWACWSPSLVVRTPVNLYDLFHASREVGHEESMLSVLDVGCRDPPRPSAAAGLCGYRLRRRCRQRTRVALSRGLGNRRPGHPGIRRQVGRCCRVRTRVSLPMPGRATRPTLRGASGIVRWALPRRSPRSSQTSSQQPMVEHFAVANTGVGKSAQPTSSNSIVDSSE